MGIFYNVSPKEKVQAMNNIFIKQGESELYKKGYKVTATIDESLSNKSNLIELYDKNRCYY